MIVNADVADLLGRWWFNYDEARFDVLPTLLTEDVHFSCRTDTGVTDFEDFVRADLSGRDEVMLWQRAHRVGSPYPLRHNGTNIHVVEHHDDREATFASYICVTHIVAGAPTLLSSAIVNGRVRKEDALLRIAVLEVVLDTRTSVPLAELL